MAFLGVQQLLGTNLASFVGRCCEEQQGAAIGVSSRTMVPAAPCDLALPASLTTLSNAAFLPPTWVLLSLVGGYTAEALRGDG